MIGIKGEPPLAYTRGGGNVLITDGFNTTGDADMAMLHPANPEEAGANRAVPARLRPIQG